MINRCELPNERDNAQCGAPSISFPIDHQRP